jgi:hypothetical protein
LACAGQTVKVDLLSLRIIKGYTKTQCVLFTMLSAADVDLSSPDAMDILRPLFPILDFAWLLPAKVPNFEIYEKPFRLIFSKFIQIHFSNSSRFFSINSFTGEQCVLR